MSFFEENRTARENFRKVSSSVGARADYVQGGGGNTSVKLEGGLMAIKASGYCLKDIDIDKAYAVLDYAALRKFYNETDPKTLADVEKTGSDHAKAAVGVKVFLHDGAGAVGTAVVNADCLEIGEALGQHGI